MEPERITWLCSHCDMKVTLGSDTIPEKCFKCGYPVTEKSVRKLYEDCGDFITMMRRKGK